MERNAKETVESFGGRKLIYNKIITRKIQRGGGGGGGGGGVGGDGGMPRSASVHFKVKCKFWDDKLFLYS